MEESTVWFFVVIQFLIICLCAYAVLKLCGIIHCVNWIRNVLRKPAEESAANVNADASRSNFNKTATTEQSMISMQQHHPNFSYQVPIVLPYPMYQMQPFQGESQGQDMTNLSVQVQPPGTPKVPIQSPYQPPVTPKLTEHQPATPSLPAQNSYPLGFCISSTAVATCVTEEKKQESETKI